MTIWNALLAHCARMSRRILLVLDLPFRASLCSWESAVQERLRENLKSRYFLGMERVEQDPPSIRIYAFWDGENWVEKELRARTYSYLGAWWQAFRMAGNDSIVIIRKPYSPRDWSPRTWKCLCKKAHLKA